MRDILTAVCFGCALGSGMGLLVFLVFVWSKAAPENQNRQFIVDTNTAPTGARVKTRTERGTEWLYWLPNDSTQVYCARMSCVRRGVLEYAAVAWKDSAFADEPPPKLPSLPDPAVRIRVEKPKPQALPSGERTQRLLTPPQNGVGE